MDSDTIETNARLLVAQIAFALSKGVKHYALDSEELCSVEAILNAFLEDGEIQVHRFSEEC